LVISSRDNAFIKLVRSLRLRDHREAERAFVVEGRRGVSDAIAAGGRVRYLALREGEEPGEFAVGSDWVRILDAKLFAFVSETTSPQGVLAVFETPDTPIPARPHPLFMILDAIADPGNLGAIIRTSAAAGVDALFLGPNCVDWLNGKVVRSAMGAHFRLAIRPFDETAQAMVLSRCPVRVLSDGEAEITHDQVDWTAGAALIIGSEAHGASQEFRSFATVSAAIPMAGGVESLNAAIAAGVIVFEARRQRRRSTGLC
jgi:TrmH family RNA methyltransferase